MKLEEVIGANVAWLREDRGLSQSQLGEALGEYLGNPWSRQAVSAAEKGRRAFTAAELISLSLTLNTSLAALLMPQEELSAGAALLPGHRTVTQEQYERILFRDGGGVSPAVQSLSLGRLRVLLDAYRDLLGLTTQIRGAARSGLVLLENAEKTLQDENGEDGEHQEAP